MNLRLEAAIEWPRRPRSSKQRLPRRVARNSQSVNRRLKKGSAGLPFFLPVQKDPKKGEEQ
jgi:hypothetical protein